MRIGEDDPWKGERLNEGLSDGRRVTGCEGREPALVSHINQCFVGSILDLRKYVSYAIRSASFLARRRTVCELHRGCRGFLAKVSEEELCTGHRNRLPVLQRAAMLSSTGLEYPTCLLKV
jgi:hypothetical protein